MLWNKFIITNTLEHPPSRPLLLCYSETYSLQRENLHSNWADNNSPLGGSTGVAGVGGLKNTNTKYIMYYLESKTTSPCGHSSAGGELAVFREHGFPPPRARNQVCPKRVQNMNTPKYPLRLACASHFPTGAEFIRREQTKNQGFNLGFLYMFLFNLNSYLQN